MNAKRAEKIQVPKLISYCGPAVFGLLIIMGALSTTIPSNFRVVMLLVPIPVGAVLGLAFYRRIGHQLLEYDDRGFKLTTGRSSVQFDWDKFKEVSLAVDPKGWINVRLYFDETYGKYIEIPASRIGADPFSMRNMLMTILKRPV